MAWARLAGERHPELERVAYFGSYARDDWGIGSDLDVLLVLSEAHAPFIERAAAWDLLSLPVPVDLLVLFRGRMDDDIAAHNTMA